MGKSLIVPGADFSENGFLIKQDITALAEAEANTFYAQKTIASFTSSPAGNQARCCIYNLDIATLADMTKFSKLRIDIRDGYDYVIGVNRTGTDTSANWTRIYGESSGGSFNWITTNQYILTDLSSVMTLRGNIRHDNNTTNFSSSAKLSDFVTLTLLP